MPYEPLHHKYRPQMFSELVGQEAIATTLSNALEQRRIAPAYLFSGPRGTGKTSSARILAKSLNCLNAANPTPSPCGECEVCRAIANGSALDVIEIDAASNTGVDNIRELIERAQFAPVQCRYKVYVIDECHMLSVAAFNALLKTLEEPPAHVVFVLATTDPQRVLPTIISRCQRFDYRRIPLDAMVGHLRKIARNENIDIPLESVTLVAQIANGGLRDAESLLDQLSLLAGEIVPDKVWDLVGAVPERDLLGLIQVIRSNHPESVIEQCRTLLNRGREPLVVLQNLASFYLNLLVAKTAPQRGDLIAVTQPTWAALCEEAKGWDTALILKGQQHLKESEYQLKNTTQPRLWLEITLLGLLPSALANIQAIATETVTIPAPVIPPAPKPAAQQKVTPPAPPVVEHPFGEVPKSSPAPVLAPTPSPLPQPQAIAPPVVAPPTPTIAPPVPQPVEPPPEIRRSPDPMPDPLPMEIPAPQAAETNGNGHHPSEEIPSEIIPPAPELVPEPPAPQPTLELNTGEISAPSSSPTISALEREQLWETMLAQLQPPTTQQLLRQQGCLVTFTGNMALVGIKSRPLLNMAKNKQKNIEEAFQKACQQTVRVSFQIGHESTSEMDDAPTAMAPPSQAPPSIAPPTPAIAPPSQSQSVPNPFDAVPSPATQSPPVAPATNPQPVASIPTPAPQPVVNRPPIAAVPTQPTAQPPTEINQESSPNAGEELASTPENGINAGGDRLNNMANEFADVFAGEVIDLPHLAPDDVAENSAGIALDTPAVIPPQTVAQAPQPEPAMGVQGRPPVTTSPEDEIPF